MPAAKLRVLEVGIALRDHDLECFQAPARVVEIYAFANIEIREHGISTGRSSKLVTSRDVEQRTMQDVAGRYESFRFWGTAVEHQKRVRSDRSSRPIEDVLRGDELVCGLVDQAVLDALLLALGEDSCDDDLSSLATMPSGTAPHRLSRSAFSHDREQQHSSRGTIDMSTLCWIDNGQIGRSDALHFRQHPAG